MNRRRRGRWILIGAVLSLVLIWLGVRALSGPSPSDGHGQGEVEPGRGGSAERPSRPPTAETPPRITTPSSPSPSLEPAAERSPLEVASPPAPPRAERAALRDRFQGLLAILGSGTANEASAARQQAEALDLNDDERSELERVCGALEIRLEGEIQAALGLARRGEVLAARARLESLVPALASRLEEVLPRFEQGVSESTSLPRDLRVRHRGADGVVTEGAITRASAREVTLRVSRAGGVVYPTVAITTIEPVTGNPEHARTLATAARAAEDLWLARLWLLRSSELSR